MVICFFLFFSVFLVISSVVLMSDSYSSISYWFPKKEYKLNAVCICFVHSVRLPFLNLLYNDGWFGNKKLIYLFEVFMSLRLRFLEPTAHTKTHKHTHDEYTLTFLVLFYIVHICSMVWNIYCNMCSVQIFGTSRETENNKNPESI